VEISIREPDRLPFHSQVQQCQQEHFHLERAAPLVWSTGGCFKFAFCLQVLYMTTYTRVICFLFHVSDNVLRKAFLTVCLPHVIKKKEGIWRSETVRRQFGAFVLYMLGDGSAGLCYQDRGWAHALVFVSIVRDVSSIYYEREELVNETIWASIEMILYRECSTFYFRWNIGCSVCWWGLICIGPFIDSLSEGKGNEQLYDSAAIRKWLEFGLSNIADRL